MATTAAIARDSSRSGTCLAWSALGGAALAASFSPLIGQLGFAGVAIGVIGMAHGASDLAIVERRHRRRFLLLYGAVSAGCLVWWISFPAIALPLFLIASAIHFGLEDAPNGRLFERVLRGTSLIATPAAFHRADLIQLLRFAGGPADWLPGAVTSLALAGGLAAAALLIVAARRSDQRLAAGTIALLMLPPLVGFSVGFLILHALPQTVCRRRRLGCGNSDYLRQVAPVLLAASALIAVIALALLRFDPTGVRSLFAAIAALAVPHLVATPWFINEKIDDPATRGS